MKTSKITMDRFERLISAYGTRPASWPADLRGPMQAFLETSAGARERLAAEQALDAALALRPEPASADAALKTRIEAAFAREKQTRATAAPAGNTTGVLDLLRLALPGGSLVPQLTGLAAAALFGILLGLQGLGGPQHYELVDASAYLVGNPALAEDLETINR